MKLTGIQDYNVIITDTSCLILLEKIEAFDVLHQLFQTVTITPQIQREYGLISEFRNLLLITYLN
jgi:predicted nucleic acid-binding protein